MPPPPDRQFVLSGRTDYHVAPEDMLRLGLAVSLPSHRYIFSVPSRRIRQDAIIRSRSHKGAAHVVVGPFVRVLIRIPPSHPYLHTQQLAMRVKIVA